ncbi:MAG: hypothetical protein KC422_17870 [Trueperaceae bacterium]|nr:hypothetical protein [Trueperaceae bacterium]
MPILDIKDVKEVYRSKGLNFAGLYLVILSWLLPAFLFSAVISHSFIRRQGFGSIEIIFSVLALSSFLIGLNLFMLRIDISTEGVVIRQWFQLNFLAWKDIEAIITSRAIDQSDPNWFETPRKWNFGTITIEAKGEFKYLIPSQLFRDRGKLIHELVKGTRNANSPIKLSKNLLPFLKVAP